MHGQGNDGSVGSGTVIPLELLLCETEGETLGDTLGDTLGETLGETLGDTLGDALGDTLGEALGETLGETLGDTLGETLGETLGDTLGEMLGEMPPDGSESEPGAGVGSVLEDEPDADGRFGSDGTDTDGRVPELDGRLTVGEPRPPLVCWLWARSRSGPAPGPHSMRATPPKTPSRMATPAAAMAPMGRLFGGRGSGPVGGGRLGPPATPERPPSSRLGPKESSGPTASRGSRCTAGMSRRRTSNPFSAQA